MAELERPELARGVSTERLRVVLEYAGAGKRIRDEGARRTEVSGGEYVVGVRGPVVVAVEDPRAGLDGVAPAAGEFWPVAGLVVTEREDEPRKRWV